MWSLLSLVHLVGLSLGVGAASVKLTLLLRCNSDSGFAETYLKIAKPITRFIIAGLVLLTLSGVGWLLLGFRLAPLLWVKILIVVLLWALGPYMDRFVEPRFAKSAPARGDAPSPEFVAARKRYVAMEATLTALMYAALLIGWRL